MCAWDGEFSSGDERVSFRVVSGHDREKRVAYFRCKVQGQREEMHQVVELQQTWFNLNLVREALHQVGFRIFDEVSADGIEHKNMENALRVFFFVERLK